MQAPLRDFLSLQEFKNWMEPYKDKLEMQLYNVLRNGSKYDYHELKIFIDERNLENLYNEPTKSDHIAAIKVWSIVALIGGKPNTLAGCNIALKCDPFYFNVMRNIDASAIIIS